MDMIEKYLLDSSRRKSTYKSVDKIGYFEHLLEGVSSMFTRSGIPDDVIVSGVEYIEPYLLEFGNAAIVTPLAYTNSYKPDKMVGWCSFGGDLYADGIGSTAIFNSRSGYTYEFEDWKANPDIVVSFNNTLKYPDLNIVKYARLLAEADTSLNLQVLYSRLYPIPLVKDEKTRLAVEDTLSKIDDGRLKAILSNNLKEKMLGDDTPAIDVLNLTQNKDTEYLQYIDHYKDDLLRWFWSIYGMNSSGASKLAQQTVGEVNQGDSLSKVIPYARYLCRLDEVKQVKEKFGWLNYKIEFGEPWKLQFERSDTDEDGTKSDKEGVRSSQEKGGNLGAEA